VLQIGGNSKKEQSSGNRKTETDHPPRNRNTILLSTSGEMRQGRKGKGGHGENLNYKKGLTNDGKGMFSRKMINNRQKKADLNVVQGRRWTQSRIDTRPLKEQTRAEHTAGYKFVEIGEGRKKHRGEKKND